MKKTPVAPISKRTTAERSLLVSWITRLKLLTHWWCASCPGLPVPVLCPSSVPLIFSCPAVLVWQPRAFSHSSLPYFPGVTTTTNYYSSTKLAFVVLTTLSHHPFNTAHNPHLWLQATSASRGNRLFRFRTLWPCVLFVDFSVHIKLYHVSVKMFLGISNFRHSYSQKNNNKKLPDITLVMCLFGFSFA